MQVVILAGGFGSRLAEETVLKPKPMVEIGGRPILWHIMKHYSHFGLNDFIICLGYKGEYIKNYFANYFLYRSDVEFDLAKNKITILDNQAEPWNVTTVDTGDATMTGGRIKRIGKYLKGDTFCMTYGDGLGNVDIRALLNFHEREGKLATVTAVKPLGRFGAIEMEGNHVTSFQEKPVGDGGHINGGFFVLSKKVLDYIDDDASIFERKPMLSLVEDNQLAAYTHEGFWQPMDTIREKNLLEELWQSGRAPWRVWDR
ncbi:MAG TPA: glucose-1-phosphate cytidylyltransferase [Bdellovibrionales bacterium]|nr:glucose-1-phosphate cytidylyltransferase [Bdellovibrionales bacterium]